MNRCPITYEEIPQEERYSPNGLKLLDGRLRTLEDLPYSAEEQRAEAVARAVKMSIQGFQPKLSARLNVANGNFAIVDTGGEFILKPPTQFREVPENEDLTMRLAAEVGVDVPLHGLIYAKDRSLTYFIKRFDRSGGGGKLALEDFAQLSQESRDTKYNSSMERVAEIIQKFCTFPSVEKVKLFRLTLLNFLVGNEDMHLKNFSLLRKDDIVALSPAYDLLSTTLAMDGTTEEIALPLGGKKRNLTHALLIDYFGRDRLGLPEAVRKDVLDEFEGAFSEWGTLLERSFLSEKMKAAYAQLLSERKRRLRFL